MENTTDEKMMKMIDAICALHLEDEKRDELIHIILDYVHAREKDVRESVFKYLKEE